MCLAICFLSLPSLPAFRVLFTTASLYYLCTYTCSCPFILSPFPFPFSSPLVYSPLLDRPVPPRYHNYRSRMRHGFQRRRRLREAIARPCPQNCSQLSMARRRRRPARSRRTDPEGLRPSLEVRQQLHHRQPQLARDHPGSVRQARRHTTVITTPDGPSSPNL